MPVMMQHLKIKKQSYMMDENFKKKVGREINVNVTLNVTVVDMVLLRLVAQSGQSFIHCYFFMET